jgi:N-acetylglutamate synthase
MKVSIADLERVAALGWRAPEESSLGDWVLRAAEGFTGRANSVLAIGDPGLPIDAAIAQARGWYAERGLSTLISTAFPVGRPDASEVDRFLRDHGWPVLRGAIVMTASAEAVARQADGVEVRDEPDEDWLDLYRYRGERPPPISRRLLNSAPWQAFGSVRLDGHTVAIGRVAVAAAWAGLTAIEVAPNYRRRGLGRLVTQALLAAAMTRDDVSGVYLQVDDTNSAARALYRQLGFADHHAYHYRVAP